MRKIFIILLIGVFQTTFSQNETLTEFEIVGKWYSEEKSDYGYFIFQKDGSAIIETKDVTFGGENFERNGKKFTLEYNIFSDVKPIKLDIIFTELKSGGNLIWPFIIKIINEDEILLARGIDGKRPINFIDSDSVILKRVE
tara:strand:+ start:64 stop:486 length:423 start_codon:yes stop_codon:yes gene_type:complete